MTSFSASPQAAARELLRRRTVRGSLTEWVRECGFEPAAHHRLIIRELEAVARGEVKRLALFLPPGSAKSTYASVLFPPWFLANRPQSSLIAASHTLELAERWGRKVRNLVGEHAATLNLGLAGDNKAAGRWETAQGGEYYAAGIGGSITGRRADLALIDDPIRSREDADSDRVRSRQWEWWNFDLATRLKPDAAVVLIQTRWHEDDLAGRILATEGERWRVVSLPMEAETNDPLGREPGQLLWPEWFTDQMVADAKRDPRVWSALYQQRPVPEDGAFFVRDHFAVADPPPLSALRVYGASDYAVTGQGGDYTVHIVVGMAADGRLYLLDVWRKQSASDEWVEAFADLVAKWKPLEWAEETGQIRAGLGPYIDRRLRERRVWVQRHLFPARGSKESRAQSIRAYAGNNKVYLPPNAPWAAEFVSECLRFPAAVHDDQVDAFGLVGQLLDKVTAPRSPGSQSRPNGMDYSTRPRGSEIDVLTM